MLMDEKGYLKVIDFGFAKKLQMNWYAALLGPRISIATTIMSRLLIFCSLGSPQY